MHEYGYNWAKYQGTDSLEIIAHMVVFYIYIQKDHGRPVSGESQQGLSGFV